MAVKKLSKEERKELRKQQLKSDVENKGAFTNKRLIDTSKFNDVKFFKPEKGRNRVDILPWIIQTDRLQRTSKHLKPGAEGYMLDVHIHTYVGPNQDTVLCLSKTFGKPCPICEHIQTAIKSGENVDDDELKSLKPKRHALFNIFSYEQEEKGIQIFDCAYHNQGGSFAAELFEEAQTGDEIVDFTDLEEGKTIEFKAVEHNFKGRAFLKYKSFKFEDRESYGEDVYDSSYPLDAMLTIPTYDEVKDLFYGVDEESGGESHAADDVQEDEEQREEEKKETPKRFLGKRPGREGGESEKKSEDKKKEDQKPQRAPLSRGAKPSKEEPEEPEEEKSTKSEKKSSPKNKCPHGHVYGKDCDAEHTGDDCSECSEWESCAEEHDK